LETPDKLPALAALLLTATLSLPAAAEPSGASYRLYERTTHAMPAAGAVYSGGSVLDSVKLVIVLWGKGVAPITAARIGPFASAIVNSTYLDALAPYANANKVSVGRGAYFGKIRINPNDKSKSIDDSEIQSELAAQIASGALPPADAETLYMVYVPPGTIVNLGGAKSCAAFGAYHAAAALPNLTSHLVYAVIPDCGGGFNDITNISSYEMLAAITDPFPTTASQPKFPQGWTTANADDIGALCPGKPANLTAAGKTYVVQQIFNPQHSVCGTANYTTP
jgi:hypothetical protein